MLGYNKTENPHWEKNYAKGFNTGVKLFRLASPDLKKNVKELLFIMIQSRPKDIVFHGILSGYSYEYENERMAKRTKDLEKLKELNRSRENDRGR